MNLSAFERFLESQGKPFLVEKNFSNDLLKAELFAYRRFNMMGRDYYFVHAGDAQILNENTCSKLHLDARNYVNSLYKMPRALRFVVPNIVSVFFSSNGFEEAALQLALQQKRPWQGGEVHDIFFVDLESQTLYGPDIHSVRVDGGNYSFKKVDPTNRSRGLMLDFFNVSKSSR